MSVSEHGRSVKHRPMFAQTHFYSVEERTFVLVAAPQGPAPRTAGEPVPPALTAFTGAKRNAPRSGMVRNHMGRRPGIAERLARECFAARDATNVKALDIAQRAGVSQATISRFEVKGLWPSGKNVERIVAAYEDCCGLERDELWRRAIVAG